GRLREETASAVASDQTRAPPLAASVSREIRREHPMHVILLERVENLGAIGDVVKVRNGFARNFLLPQHKALLATDANKARFERERAAIEARNAKTRATAETDAKSFEGETYVLIRQAGETGQLYGSVAARDIADA